MLCGGQSVAVLLGGRTKLWQDVSDCIQPWRVVMAVFIVVCCGCLCRVAVATHDTVTTDAIRITALCFVVREYWCAVGMCAGGRVRALHVVFDVVLCVCVLCVVCHCMCVYVVVSSVAAHQSSTRLNSVKFSQTQSTHAPKCRPHTRLEEV